ncbi:MAG TPA: hypothetical protein VMU93_11350 [Caulobacteraceae bacterium]|nr:hypothetical protein [Caulobacteraceae bacterium]
MGEILRWLLLVAIAGVAATLVVGACAWFMAEPRRLDRAFRNVLGAPADASLLAHGRGRAAAFSFGAGRIAVAWNSGGWCLLYGLDELMGAELALDGEVAARVLRGEPRRALDRIGGAIGEVSLRLLFDDPQHPDFELQLWPAPAGRPGAPTRAAAAIAEANRWLSRIEAVLRRSGTAAVRPAPAAARPPPPRQRADVPDLFEKDFEQEDDDLPI